MSHYRDIRFGVEKAASGDVPRHIHRAGYANVVISGAFTEASFAGRFLAGPGMVLLHAPFDCHLDVDASAAGPTILRLPWRQALEGAFRVRDVDLLARLSETDIVEAELALASMLEPLEPRHLPWVDELAAALRTEQAIDLGAWAERKSLNPASVSRGFRESYGVSPKRYRLETRTRAAWRRIADDRGTLTQIAHECSFSDLAHMSRSITEMTGASPNAWRARKAPSDRAALLRVHSRPVLSRAV